MDQYLGRLSGPLVDRLDLQIEVGPVSFEEWARRSTGGPATESSAEVRERVVAARRRQAERWKADEWNAFVSVDRLRGEGRILPEAYAALEQAQRLASCSARSLDRILRVARTAADLAGDESVSAAHVGQAMQFRSFDRLKAYANRQPV